MRPVARPNATVLILGTFPGGESLGRKMYYADKRNAFWRLVCSALGTAVPQHYESRLRVLKKSRIALWDVIRRCDREGSQDNRIRLKTAAFNRLRWFLFWHRRVYRICFNGSKAYYCFRYWYCKKRAWPPAQLELEILPSSSGLNYLSFKAKLRKWRRGLA